jgi:hypothetical protein
MISTEADLKIFLLVAMAVANCCGFVCPATMYLMVTDPTVFHIDWFTVMVCVSILSFANLVVVAAMFDRVMKERL